MDLSGFTQEQHNFGKVVKQHRKERNLRLLDVEVLTGIDNSTISKIEKGKYNVELLTIFKLAKAFNVSTMDLLDYSNLATEGKVKEGKVKKKVAAKKKTPGKRGQSGEK
jgi:transcriptional regulator with XRE-family HTH domain